MNESSSTDARLEPLPDGRFRVSGVLDAATVGPLLKQSLKPFSNGTGELKIDLAAVTQADSAALALLIEWLRIAKQARRTIRFENAPAQIVALARISEVDKLLFEPAATTS